MLLVILSRESREIMKFKEKIFNLLPEKIKKTRWTYVKGRIQRPIKNNCFFYDYDQLKRLKMVSYSQYGQDAFVYHFIFGGQNGFFLDIGGNEPIEINNSYLLELNGWKGMAFEPVKTLADKWGKVRKTPCYNIAIGAEEQEIEFTETKTHQMSGIGIEPVDKEFIKYKVCQRRLSNVLKEHNIKHVDVVFIDVEGYEMNVLEGINFDEIDITCICIENNRNGDISPDISLRKFLIDRGYVLAGRLTIDDVFIKENYF